MSDSKEITNVPQLGFWERADLPFAQLSIAINVLYAAITGVFRGKGSPRKYSHHLTAAAVRRFCDRLTDRQRQCVLYPPLTTPCWLEETLPDSEEWNADIDLPCRIDTSTHPATRSTTP